MATPSIFAIGDVHGCAEELRTLVEKLPLKSDSTLVFLGDYVDRGPDSKGVIDYLIELRSKCNVVTLKGNHESMFVDFLEHPESAGAALFVLNGGSSTLASYSETEGRFDVSSKHKKFLADCPTYFETENYFFVHAGVTNRPLCEIDETKEDTLLWIRDAFLESDYDWGKKIVHGHTPVNEVTIKSNRINVDTGCVFGGKLSAVQLPEEKVFQVSKDAPAQPRQLPDQHENRRVARRFSGAVEVFVIKNGQVCGFETLNYNEFGLLIRELAPTDNPFLKIGEEIEGVIGQNPVTQIGFTGQVVRVDLKSKTPMYGVKMTVKTRK